MMVCLAFTCALAPVERHGTRIAARAVEHSSVRRYNRRESESEGLDGEVGATLGTQGRSPHNASGVIPMICFEVYRNGKKIRTAGIEEGLLSFSLMHVTGRRNRSELLGFNISGIIDHDHDDNGENVTWSPLNRMSVKVGDKLAIKIVDRPKCDNPVRRRPARKRKRRPPAT